jgi:hypothetical protein
VVWLENSQIELALEKISVGFRQLKERNGGMTEEMPLLVWSCPQRG